LSCWQKAVNRAHARIPRLANGPWPRWRAGRSWPSCAAAPLRATAVVAAVLVLHKIETRRNSGW